MRGWRGWLVTIALVGAGACVKKDDPLAEVHAQMEHIRDQMCRCTDPACANKVLAESVQWYRANMAASERAANAVPDEAGVARERAVTAATEACEAKARGQAEITAVTVDAAPPSPPDASTVESIHGYCELEWTGTMNGATRVGMERVGAGDNTCTAQVATACPAL